MEHTIETNAAIEAFRQETAKIRQDMAVMSAETRVQFAHIEARMERGFASVIKWVIGLVGGAMVSFVTVITFVLNHAS